MSEPRKIRILIADGHPVVRLGLIALSGAAEDVEIVAEAGDGNRAVELFAELLPDVVLIDLRLPCGNGADAYREILGRRSDARVLILTAFDGDTDIRRAFEAGISGYILKRSPADSLLPALRAVAEGGTWIPEEVSDRLASKTSFENLTARELDVLNEIATGLSNKEIAGRLGISLHTAKEHVRNILAKLRVAYRTEAVSVAVKRGIIEL